MSHSICLLSGGLDSATSCAIALKEGHTVTALSFRYGQRHYRELESAKYLTDLWGINHVIVDIDLSQFGGSSLVKDGEVPITGVVDGEIPSTYVPGRNTVFIAIALSLAEAKGADSIYLGVNAVDYSGYPDCRPEYINAYQELSNLSSKTAIQGSPINLVAPLITMTKVDIVKKAMELGVPIDKTWSCYLGGEKPCGVCDSCRIRDEAVKTAYLTQS